MTKPGPYRDGDLSRLAGFLNEPYRMEAVVAAARGLQPPFILREIVQASGLPTPIVHRVLGRLVKKGLFTRFKVKATFDGLTGANRYGSTHPKLRKIPGGRKVLVWAYMPVEPSE